MNDTPGTSWATEVRSVRPRACRSAPLSTVRLIGVFCTVDSRFSAVTTISCRSWLVGDTCAHAGTVSATPVNVMPVSKAPVSTARPRAAASTVLAPS